MTNQEAIAIIKTAIAEVEWDYPMEYAAAFDVAIEALEAKEPREITKQEWEAWKKAKNRDPLCCIWVGDKTPYWIIKPEDINEVLYLAGSIKIFNGKPTKEQSNCRTGR